MKTAEQKKMIHLQFSFACYTHKLSPKQSLEEPLELLHSKITQILNRLNDFINTTC